MLAGLLLVLNACMAVPQPFGLPVESKAQNRLPLAALTGGVLVLPVEGPVPWVGTAMAEAMAAELRRYGLAASARAGNHEAQVLAGWAWRLPAADGGGRLRVDWVLMGGDGEPIGRTSVLEHPPRAFWTAPDTAMFAQTAATAARRVAAWTRPGGRSAVAGPAASVVTAIEIAADGVADDGVAGGGLMPLRRALVLMLQARRIPVRPAAAGSAGAVSVRGRLQVRPAGQGEEQVALLWAVLAGDGRRIGTVQQEDRVPAGRFLRPWDDLAAIIAEGAADGIAALLRRRRPAAAP